MTLTYRGVDYVQPVHITAETSPGKVGGKYRGLDWRFRHLAKAPVLSTNLNMLYRGLPVAGSQNGSGSQVQAEVTTQPEAVPASVPVLAVQAIESAAGSVESLARTLLMGHQRNLKIRQQSMLFRVAHEVGLSDAHVGQYWNKIQGKVHPTFRDTLDRSHATMS